MDGDEQGDKNIIEIMEEVAYVAAGAEHDGRGMVDDVALRRGRVSGESELSDSDHDNVFPFPWVRPDRLRWKSLGGGVGRVDEEEGGG